MKTDSSAGALDALALEIFEGHPAPTLVVAPDRRTLMANGAARAMFGLGADGAPLPMRRGQAPGCVHSGGPGGSGGQEEGQGCVICDSIERAFRSGAAHRARASLRLPGDDRDAEIAVLVSASPIRRDGTTHVVLTLETSDAHLKEEFLRTEEALRHAHERATSLARFPEENPDPVLRITSDLRLGYANAAARSALADLQLEVGRAAPPGLAEGAHRAKQDGQRVSTQVSCAGRVFRLSFCPIGAEVNVYGDDVTDRKRAMELLGAEKERLVQVERALRESEAQLRTIIENLGEGLVVSSLDGQLIHWNRAALDMHGFDSLDEVRRGLSEFAGIFELSDMDGTVLPLEQWPLARILRGQTVRDLEIRIRRLSSDWNRVYSYGGCLVRDPDGEPLMAVVTISDVTGRKRSEQVLRDADRHKSEFLNALSHELRNPLAPIRNSLYLLDRAAPASEQAARAKVILRRQTEHLARLIDDLLDVTRISKGKIRLSRTVIDAREVVRDACEDHRTMFDHLGVELRAELPPEPVWIDADPTRMSQVVGNLLQNAAKFTPPGGATAVTAAVADGRAELRVRDDGVGIDPEFLDRMFEPFVQAERDLARTQGGLGLGLSLVKGMVELHGGSVVARSNGPNQGSEFVVSLPAAPAPRAASDEAGRQRRHEARTVLVIEDNPDAGQALADVLALHGHGVQVAADGGSGIAKARAMRPDVIFCDIGLPDVDGYEVARTLRADPALQATYLVALSGYAGEEDLVRAKGAGFDSHLPKPSAIDELLAVLSNRRAG